MAALIAMHSSARFSCWVDLLKASGVKDLLRVCRSSLLCGYIGGVMVASLAGCSGDHPTALVPHLGNRGFWTLELNTHALNLATVAPYNMGQLTATPLDQDGVPLTGLKSVTFRVQDSTVAVDSTGHVTARFKTNGRISLILASMTSQGVTLTDTVLVQVTDTVPHQAIDTFSLQPIGGDSAKRAVNFSAMIGNGFSKRLGDFSWSARIVDRAGHVLCDRGSTCPLLVYYQTSDPLVAQIDPATGAIIPQRPGPVVFRATTYAYGQMEQDSVIFRIGYSLAACFVLPGTQEPTFFNYCALPPSEIILAPGALVTFSNPPLSAIDDDGNVTVSKQVDGVTFTSPSNMNNIDTATAYILGCCSLDQFGFGPTGTGNIAPFQGDTNSADGGLIMYLSGLQARRFRAVGNYRWTTPLVPQDTFTIEIRNDL